MIMCVILVGEYICFLFCLVVSGGGFSPGNQMKYSPPLQSIGDFLISIPPSANLLDGLFADCPRQEFPQRNNWNNSHD